MKTRLGFIAVIATCVAVLLQVLIWQRSQPPVPITSGTDIEVLDVQLQYTTSEPELAQLAFETDFAALEDAGPVAAFPNFPLGITQTIDFNSDEGTRERLSKREWRDQVRDWLLLTVISDSGLTAYDIGNAVFDLPPLRYGYVKASGQFEYGTSRSCYIGDGRILAIIAGNVSAAAREDAIADVIDRHRKDQAGEIKSVVLFEYRLLDKALTAKITRRANIDVAPYLMPGKGYHEMVVASVNDLQHFLNTIDDLTLAKVTAEGLLLGGRKVRSYDYRGIGLQEVAAVWQSEQDISRKKQEFDAFVQSEQIKFNSRWPSRGYYSQFDTFGLNTKRDLALKRAQQKISQRAREMGIVDSSGFSLDPTYDYAGLHAYLLALLSNNEQFSGDKADNRQSSNSMDTLLRLYLPMLQPRLNNVIDALAKENIFPFRQLRQDLINTGGETSRLLAIVLNEVSEKFHFQAARYDGNLQGTEAGMVLFYTDLLAKIWAMDYLDSAPGDKIEEFVDDTTIKLASLYDKESRELPAARLWFGPTDRGFQVADENNQLYFQRIATRVYSKGNDPLDPTRTEVQTSAFLAAPIDWWDDHYQEVARYEPEYFRLNEIMKWSLLIGFLNEGGNMTLLDYLNTVNVDRSNWFPVWARNNKDLQFDLWGDVTFYKKGYKGTTTEAMEYLRGKLTEGGVSLAPKKLFRNRASITPKLNKLTRRSYLNYSSARAGMSEFKTLDGFAVKLQRDGPSKVVIRNTPKPGLRLRAPDGDLVNTAFHRVITKTRPGLRVKANAGSTRLGDLNIAKTSNGFKVGWQARDIDAGQMLVRRASRSAQPEKVFTQDPAVDQLVKMPDPDTYAIKLRNSDKWMIASRGGGDDATVGGGWQSRVAEPQSRLERSLTTPQKGGMSYQLKWVDQTVIEQQVSQSQWLVVHPRADARIPIVDLSARGPPSEGTTVVRLTAGEQQIPSTMDRATGILYVSSKQGSGTSAHQLLELPQRIGSQQFRQLQNVAKQAQEAVSVPLTPPSPINNALMHGDIRRVAAAILAEPERSINALNKELVNDLNVVSNLVAKGDTGSALSQLSRLSQRYGPHAEIKLWEGLAELVSGRPHLAAEAVTKSIPGRLRKHNVFIKEIHARLARPGLTQSGRDSLSNLEHYANWQNQHGIASNVHGRAVPTVDQNKLAFEFHFSKPLRKARLLSPDEVRSLTDAGVPIYRQTSPGLNNLDWQGSHQHAIAQAIDLKLGKVVVLPEGDVTSFNPTKIVAPAEPSHAAAGTQHFEFIRTMARTASPAGGGGGGDGDEPDDEEEALLRSRLPAGLLPNQLYLLVDQSWQG